MRVAYADPPYMGRAKEHYGPEAREVNHPLLIEWLDRDFDCWALSLSSISLQRILAMCPDDVRIAAWVKPFAVFRANVNPAYAWEPVIFKGARKRSREDLTVRDWCRASITLQKGTKGAKPHQFCSWLFRLLNLEPDDEFVDVFPGSGIVGKTWDHFSQSPELALFMKSTTELVRHDG